MKAQEFISTMRKLIREEVRLAVREELSALKGKKNVVQETRKPVQQVKQKTQTGNSILDQVLAETRVERGFGGETSPVLMEDMSFTTDNIQNTGMYNDEMPSLQTQGLPFMKDYSKLLKKADEISKNKSF